MFPQCVHEFTLQYGLGMSLFLAGLVGGVTHCAVMCGPFVLAQMGGVRRLSGALLIPYHLGRMTTYVGLAMLFHSMLNLAFLFLPVKTFIIMPILFFAGIVFIGNAFPVFSTLFPWINRIYIRSHYGLILGFVEKFIHNPTVFGRYGLGVLLGFMPCGLVISAIMAASTAPDSFQAGVVMAGFAAGTVPALVGAGLGGQVLAGAFPAYWPKIRQGLMVVSGLWLIALASLMLL